MMNIQLTKDADQLVCLLYKQYLLRRKEGISKTDAKAFGSSMTIQKEFLPNADPADVNETCWELSRAGILKTLDADDAVYLAYLNDSGIVYMENRFKDGLKGLLEYISKFSGLLTI